MRRSPPETSAQRLPVVSTLARLAVRAIGWRIEGGIPEDRRFVLVCAPHTSRWDLWVTLLFSSAMGLRLHWLGKHTLFWWPSGLMLRTLGGIPIDRDGGQDAVRRIASRFSEGGSFVLAISPEGAKRWRPGWRSGFWHIARTAEVPIVLAALDWRHRVCRVGPAFQPGRIEEDIERLRVALADVTPRHPDRFGPVKLKSAEDGAEGREAG